ncbi:MAG: protein kinase [Chloroflexi bacterium]|nr:protein kinase [Chloroflexota bacterium]
MFDLTGRTLGKYHLIEKIGQGGMAQVYKAYQPDLDRYVAAKVLLPHLTGDPEFAARFQREARAVAALEHPNIIHLYDFDSDGAVAFLVMEYLPGSNLKARLHELDCRNERMDLAEVCRLVGALAAALDHAHREGVVHRDIKPSNVLLAADGRPVLTDFGIALMVDATAITASGGMPGTPAYMSPEQGKGEPGNARSDIYALGVLLYRLCTGRLPFDADTPYAIILKHINAPLPSPRTVRPDLPEALERVILKAMAKRPTDRFQSAGNLAEALQTLAEPIAAAGAARARAAAPSARQRQRGRPMAVALAAALVLLAAVALLPRSAWWTGLGQRPTPTPPVVAEPATLTLAGPEAVDDTWLDPDLPDEVWQEADLVHLQGPLTPDRILLRFHIPPLPDGATVVSATLTLRVELWGDQSFPGAAVVYRILTAWEPTAATYNTPWSAPGLSAGVDYDPTPLDMAPAPDAGWLTLDVSGAARAWIERGEPNQGLLLMMSEDSHNQAHHWVYMSEQRVPADQPTLRINHQTSP